jgi:hypothetical protein
MNVDTAFPLKFWINLGRREDRRLETEARLEEAGLSAERFAAADARNMRRREGEVRGYGSAGRYALALTQRLAIREAKRRNAPAVLLIEDDVVFHPNFRALIQAVELPEDWGIFYLGCTHNIRPEWAGSRVIRAKYAVDTHAVAIRSTHYDRVLEMLDRHGKPDEGVAKASDQFLALLHAEIPAYSCYPNLAWQDVSTSDLLSVSYSNYFTDGCQKNWPDAVEGLLEELVTEKGGAPAKPKLALLFLTRGDVHHPDIWREFVAEAPGRIGVFSHSKFPHETKGGFLDRTAISKRIETKWGDVSLVRAAREMLLEALEDDSFTHFALLSESCVPVRPLPEILRRLELDARSQFNFRTLKDASPRHAKRADSAPAIPAGCWRFTSQWWLMDRTAAVFAAGEDYTELFASVFAADEAYFATMLAMQGYPLESLILKRDSTWVSWEMNAGSPNEWMNLPREQLMELLHSGACFARKFPKGSDIGKYGLHRTAEPQG